MDWLLYQRWIWSGIKLYGIKSTVLTLYSGCVFLKLCWTVLLCLHLELLRSASSHQLCWRSFLIPQGQNLQSKLSRQLLLCFDPFFNSLCIDFTLAMSHLIWPTYQLAEAPWEFPVQSSDGFRYEWVDAVFDHVTMDDWTDEICFLWVVSLLQNYNVKHMSQIIKHGHWHEF